MASLRAGEGAMLTALWSQYQSVSKMVLSNYTPKSWWECDLWRLTLSGYTTEYEVKLTVADFKADAKKHWLMTRDKQNARPYNPKFVDMSKPGMQERFEQVYKHELIERRDPRAPNRFYFVTPKDLAVDIPDWAGHIVAPVTAKQLRENPRLIRGRKCLQIRQQAPTVHQNKWKADADFEKKLMYRYWNSKTTLLEKDQRLRCAKSDVKETSKALDEALRKISRLETFINEAGRVHNAVASDPVEVLKALIERGVS